MRFDHPCDRQPRAFRGSNLGLACALDAAYPGFLNRLFHASDLRRSAIFAALAEIEIVGATEVALRLCRPDLDDGGAGHDIQARIARDLLALRARAIVRATYGDVPDGYLGLLARLGPDPLHDRGLYRTAYDLFAEPRHRPRAKLLRQAPKRITGNMIETAARLDPVLLHQRVIERIRSAEQVETLHAALALIRALVPDATDEALHRSLDGLGPSHRDMRRWTTRWLRRMTRLPMAVPIPANDADLHVLNGPELIELGRRFKNCAVDRLGHMATGLRAYVEWAGEGGPAVVELRRLSGGHYLVEDIRGPNNSDLEPEHRERIRAKLAGFGVLSPVGLVPTVTGGALASLLGVWSHDDGEADPFLAELLGEAA